MKCCFGHVELFTKRFHQSVSFRPILTSNLLNDFVGIFRRWALLSMLAVHGMIFALCHSISDYCVSRVVRMVAQIQMVRSDARRVVAMVKHPFSFWYFTTCQNPRHPVGRSKPSPPRKLTIPVCFFGLGPIPAGASFIYSLPKMSLRSFVGVSNSKSDNSFVMFGCLSSVGTVHS